MEVLFPHTINKTTHKALKDTTSAGKTHTQTWKKKSEACRRKAFSMQVINDSDINKNTQILQA